MGNNEVSGGGCVNVVWGIWVREKMFFVCYYTAKCND